MLKPAYGWLHPVTARLQLQETAWPVAPSPATISTATQQRAATLVAGILHKVLDPNKPPLPEELYSPEVLAATRQAAVSLGTLAAPVKTQPELGRLHLIKGLTNELDLTGEVTIGKLQLGFYAVATSPAGFPDQMKITDFRLLLNTLTTPAASTQPPQF